MDVPEEAFIQSDNILQVVVRATVPPTEEDP